MLSVRIRFFLVGQIIRNLVIVKPNSATRKIPIIQGCDSVAKGTGSATQMRRRRSGIGPDLPRLVCRAEAPRRCPAFSFSRYLPLWPRSRAMLVSIAS